ncbi:MAG: DUF4434 domain-containing protein [Patescibacteria group bacterium]
MVGSFFAVLNITKNNTELRSKAAGSTIPISGTFYMGDTNATPAQLRLAIQEMADTGIDTIIILASGYLGKTNGVYNEITYFNDPNNTIKNVMRFAYESGMDIYIGLAAYTSNWPPKIDDVIPANGTPTNLNTDQGRLIDYSIRLVDAINTAATTQGIPLNNIKGYYFGELGPANLLAPADLAYWKYLSQLVKAKAPNKKILISPYVLQENTYAYIKSAYDYVYRETLIDIIAPQDSMGSGKVKTYEKSVELFRALRDSTAAFPGREAWANIETFQPENSDFAPSNITRVSSQITSAKPYVSKMITWIYQHTMLSNPAFDNIYSWTGQYTPAHAVMRQKLRNDYMEFYANGNRITAVWIYNGNLVVTNNSGITIGAAGQLIPLNITYLGSDNQVKRLSVSKPIVQEGANQVFYIGLSTLPNFDQSKPFTAAIAPISPPTVTSTPSPTSIAIPTSTPLPTATPLTSTPTPLRTPTSSPSITPTISHSANDADIDDNGKVNIIDYTLFMSGWWLKNLNTTDLNDDGKISVIDYTIFMNGWYDHDRKNK